MKLFGNIYPAVLALLVSSASHGAQKTITWETEHSASSKPDSILRKLMRRDSKTRSRSSSATASIRRLVWRWRCGPGGSLTSNTGEYQQACEREQERVENLAVLDLPGIESYRKRSLEELEEGCWFDVLKGRAAAGDPTALREFTPSVAKCSPFIDALEGKTDIRAVWRDMVEAECRENGSPEKCKAAHFSAESRPNAEDAIRLDVLNFGWNNCSTAYLKTGDLRPREAMRTALAKNFRRRFKVKAFPALTSRHDKPPEKISIKGDARDRRLQALPPRGRHQGGDAALLRISEKGGAMSHETLWLLLSGCPGANLWRF